MPAFDPEGQSFERDLATCSKKPCPNDEVCDPASGCSSSSMTCLPVRSGIAGVHYSCFRTDKPLVCGDAHCEGEKPLCVGSSDTRHFSCVAPFGAAMSAHECRSPSDCVPGSTCCLGLMNNRCSDPGQCGGGDTPTVACDTVADCPDQLWGKKVTSCVVASDASVPGTKVCR